MEFQAFAKFITAAPRTLNRLIGKAGLQLTPGLTDQLVLFFQHLVDEDIQQFRRGGTISATRLTQLGAEVGLDAPSLSLPLHLFKLYSDEEGARRVCHSFTEEEILFYLGDPLSAKYVSSIEGAIVSWNPDSSRLLFILEDDEAITAACERYLQSKGRSFSSIDQLVGYAESNQWPGWRTIRAQYYGSEDAEVGADDLQLDENDTDYPSNPDNGGGRADGDALR
jgi:hypothetical protein